MPFQIGQSKKTEELEKQLHQTQASGQSQEQAP
jgi:hypothetical protein